MSEEAPVRYVVTNHQDQPLEVHLESRVIVLPARETVELPETDLATPQLGVLLRNGLVATHPVIATRPTPASHTGSRGTSTVEE